MTEIPPQQSGVRLYLNRNMLICISLGFSSGLPLYILINLLTAWLKTEGVDLKSIGLFALVGFPYTWKFLWSPFMDRFSLPFLGRRRGWMLVTQIGLLLVIVAMGQLSPKADLLQIVWLCGAMAFISASQDIVIDAYRREILTDAQQAPGIALYVNAYKFATLIPGSLSLILSDHFSWGVVFFFTGLFMLPGILTTLMIKEPQLYGAPPKNIREAVVMPFQEFLQRKGVSHALMILCFIFLYKLGDSMATALQTPFFIELGFTRTQIGLVAKSSGLWASLAGGILGAMWLIKTGINRGLWIFGVIQAVAILGFALYYLLSARPSVYLVDFAVFEPPEEWQVRGCRCGDGGSGAGPVWGGGRRRAARRGERRGARASVVSRGGAAGALACDRVLLLRASGVCQFPAPMPEPPTVGVSISLGRTAECQGRYS